MMSFSCFAGKRATAIRMISAGAIAVQLAACAALPSAGPSSGRVNRASEASVANADIKIVDVSDSVARQILATQNATSFAQSLGDGYAPGTRIGRGDVLDIAIWEAPPAALFGPAAGDARALVSTSTSRGTTFPEQMVDSDGRISIPFVGAVAAAGRSPHDVEREIVRRLSGKAHLPQVIVRSVRSVNSNVTVVGDVSSSARVSITAKGERLLDVLASVGGVKQPVGKMTIQITRGPLVVTQALSAVIRDPRQNIRLQPDDIVTALYQPFSFTALGATGRNEELPFEGTGLTLAQALGRAAGLQDQRADARGVFIFRLENPAALDPAIVLNARRTPDGKIPVIYRVDLKNPSSFFVAQSFPIEDKDVLYVSNAPVADLQKFVSVISSTIIPVATVATVAP